MMCIADTTPGATYVFHPVTSTDDLDDMWLTVDGVPVKMHLVRTDNWEAPQSGKFDDECGGE